MVTEEIALEGRKLAGRYLLEERIASGGMGTLWRGHDEVLGRAVAVKILHDRLARDPELLERFRVEAVAAARLSHPNVVRVFDTGVDDGVCFIVMELVDGRSLAEVLAEEGPLPAGEAAAIVRDVVLGLGHAHREGVVHRDVKPANVLIDRSGLVKVADFGIAKAAFAGDDLTTTGSLLGTVKYLAPEQVTGAPVDGRTDVYAAGVVLYEALTGRSPFEGETHIATATMRLAKDPVAPSALRPAIPRSVDAVVMRALERDPGARFDSAEQMASALDRSTPAPTTPVTPAASGATPSPAAAPPGGTLRSWLMVPIALVVVAALAVGAFLLLEGLPGGGDGGPGDGDDRALEELEIAGALSHDPEGTNGEHDDDLPYAVDGDPQTYWQTERYNAVDMDKSGVGLVVELADETDVSRVDIHTDTPGWRFSLYAADSVEEIDLDQPLASADGAEAFQARGSTEIALESVTARYVIIWLTELVPAPDGDGHRVYVNEVEIRGPGG